MIAANASIGGRDIYRQAVVGSAGCSCQKCRQRAQIYVPAVGGSVLISSLQVGAKSEISGFDLRSTSNRNSIGTLYFQDYRGRVPSHSFAQLIDAPFDYRDKSHNVSDIGWIDASPPTQT